MDLVRYLTVVIRRLWLIVLCVLIAGASAYGVSTKLPPQYEASATMLLRQTSLEQEMSYDTVLAVQQMAQTYSRMLVQRPVLATVIATLDLKESADSLVKRIQVEAVPNTSLIRITARDTAPQRAAAIANEIAKVFIQQYRDRELQYYDSTRRTLEDKISRLDQTATSLQSRISSAEDANETAELEEALETLRSNRGTLASGIAQIQIREAQLSNDISVVEEARAPAAPASPRLFLNTIIGAFAGLAIALGIAFVCEFVRQLRSLPEMG